MIVELARCDGQPPCLWQNTVGWEAVQDIFLVKTWEGRKRKERMIESGAGCAPEDLTMKILEKIVQNTDIVGWGEKTDVLDCES